MDRNKPTIKVNPQEYSNILSEVFFFYTLKLFRKGSKKHLDEDDLYEVRTDYNSSKLGDFVEQEWKKTKYRTNPSILVLLWNCFGIKYLLLGCTQILSVIIAVVQPAIIGKLVSYFAPHQTEISKSSAYIYGAVFITVNFLDCLYTHNYNVRAIGIGIRARTAICSLIYRKILKLNLSNLHNISVGQITNIMTKDVSAFEAFTEYFNPAWSGVIKTAILCYILYTQIGLAVFVIIIIFLMVIILIVCIGFKVTLLKVATSVQTDKRLHFTQEVLIAIKTIKSLIWEQFFYAKITHARKKEVNIIQNIFLLCFFNFVLFTFAQHTGLYLLLMTYIWLGNTILPETVYIVFGCFQGMAFAILVAIPYTVMNIAKLLAATKRIGKLIVDLESCQYQTAICNSNSSNIIICNMTVEIKDEVILQEINLNISTGLILLTGPNGAGKTSLLKTILHEYKPTRGTVYIGGRVSYASQEPWLFPESIRQNIIFHETFDENRYKKVIDVCSLVYDFNLLSDGDLTIVTDGGANLSKGQQARVTLARTIYKESDIYLLDDCLSSLDTLVVNDIIKKCILQFLQNKLVILTSHEMKFKEFATKTITLQNGRIVDVHERGKIFQTEAAPLLKMGKILNNVEYQEEHEDYNDETKLIAIQPKTKLYHEINKSGNVKFNIYLKYAQLGGGFFSCLLVFSLFAGHQLLIVYKDKLLSYWVNMEETVSNFNSGNSSEQLEHELLLKEINRMPLRYSVLIGLIAAATLLRVLALFVFIKKVSINIHKKMITRTMNATMEFFDNNLKGNIINRFSKDLETIDEAVPITLYVILAVVLEAIGIILAIASVNILFLIPAAVFLLTVYVLKTFYLKVGTNLKRLNASTRSPMVGHLNATLEGLSTIRAFKAEEMLRSQFDKYQDVYTSASYILMSHTRAFMFGTDTLCVIFVAMVIMKFLIFDHDTPAGDVGLVISQASMLVGVLCIGIMQWASLQTLLTSVERVMENIDVKQENNEGLIIKDWPKFGKIKYKNVSLAYSLGKLVLDNIHFLIKPRERVAIVGRTGAGKSSIISALFRLYEVNGSIYVDDVDIKTVSLNYLRSKIAVIPQDPVLISGTIRDNIDPKRLYTDSDIWKAIELAKLKNLIPSLELIINKGNKQFNMVQKQLICLIRVILHQSKIIVLDEATEHMDGETTALIHNILDSLFPFSTVLTIAHKLKCILNYDKVLVLCDGKVVEFDDPSVLLDNKEGFFYEMIKAAHLL